MSFYSCKGKFPRWPIPVVRQSFSRGPERGVSWWSRREYDYRLDTARRLYRGWTRVRMWSAHIHIYIRTGRKSIRTMPLDCNDGAALRVAPVIAIKDQVFERGLKGKRLTQLLGDPSARRMLRNVNL